ncbi:multicopper oxidase domain-containing protein [Streptomyces sp. HNM0575]|uniref:multicopper oxidase domain-containing protein n=1 Tax=Streptomyces sp. HNM0575 TaxID=2716338 RepID=UPI00145E48CB|nr:multicopper oxidase domain-containing protein [Streptomyces sp. HNM0575]NLU73096.1 multicopper oxidase domain-containing protein [Streptomyces sp. HNM0575]
MTETSGSSLARRSFSRRLLAGSAAAALGPAVLNATPAAAAPSGAESAPGALAATEARASAVRRAGPGGEVRHMKLYAQKLADDQIGYGLEKGKATIPGPLIELVEGDTLHVEFENTTDTTVSLHPHGVDYDRANDGTKMNGSVVEPGGKRTYTWRTHAPGKREDGTYRPGSAGYWHYHDHIVGTEHGTGGIRAGLYGPLVVRREGDILPDSQLTVVFNDMTINNQPKGPDFKVTVGDRVEIVMITHGEYYHTFHVHGHRWADNRTGLLEGPDDPSRIIDNKITGPADSFGFQIIAGEEAGAGAWMYHCHVQSHADMGMAGLLLVAKPDGTVPGHDGHH